MSRAMVRSQLFLRASTFANLLSADFTSTVSLFSWTWDVPNLIRDAEEADGAA